MENYAEIFGNVLFKKISIPLPWKVFQIEAPIPPEIPF